MIKQFKFTDKAIKALPANPKDSKSTELEVSDTQVTGLKCSVSRTGRRRFMLRYLYHGRKQSISLGSFDEVNVATARKIAQKHKLLVSEGINPKEQETPTLALTLNTFFFEHYLPSIKKRKKTWRDDLYRYDVMIAPKLGEIPFNQLRTIDIEKLHLGLLDTINKFGTPYAPATCNQALMIIKSMAKYAVHLDVIPDDLSLPVKLFRLDNARTRFLDVDEMKLLLCACETYSNKTIAGYIALLALSGLRSSEAANIKWEHVDLQKRIIVIPTTKNGTARSIYLTDKMLTFIEQIKQIPENPYLFTGRASGKPLTNARKTLNRLLNRAGIDSSGVCQHTLRHSVGSNLVSNGVSLRLVQEQLQHKSIISTQRYAKLTTESMKQTSETLSNLLT